MKMTLDEYQAKVKTIAERLRSDFSEVLTEGIQSGLDEHLLATIFEREFNKVMGK